MDNQCPKYEPPHLEMLALQDAQAAFKYFNRDLEFKVKLWTLFVHIFY